MHIFTSIHIIKIISRTEHLYASCISLFYNFINFYNTWWDREKRGSSFVSEGKFLVWFVECWSVHLIYNFRRKWIVFFVKCDRCIKFGDVITICQFYQHFESSSLHATFCAYIIRLYFFSRWKFAKKKYFVKKSVKIDLWNFSHFKMKALKRKLVLKVQVILNQGFSTGAP
jgi:hypothetical protein